MRSEETLVFHDFSTPTKVKNNIWRVQSTMPVPLNISLSSATENLKTLYPDHGQIDLPTWIAFESKNAIPRGSFGEREWRWEFLAAIEPSNWALLLPPSIYVDYSSGGSMLQKFHSVVPWMQKHSIGDVRSVSIGRSKQKEHGWSCKQVV